MAARKPEYILNYEIAQMKFATARGLVCRVDGCSLPAISGPDERRRDGGQLCHGHSLPVQDHVYDERAAFTKFRDFLNVCPGYEHMRGAGTETCNCKRDRATRNAIRNVRQLVS